MIVRIRSPVGVWRISDVSADSTVEELLNKISAGHKLQLTAEEIGGCPLRMENAMGRPGTPVTGLGGLGATLGSLGVQNGSLLFLELPQDRLTVHEESQVAKKITADGKIEVQTFEDRSKRVGFRPGMMALRSMKMQWTLNDFMLLDGQFTYKMTRQKEAICKGVSLDSNMCASFQSYLHQFAFQQSRMGYLYGKFLEDGKVQVEACYEPPQEGSPEGFELAEEDPLEERVNLLTSLLNLERVGWIFSHPPREEGFMFSNAEILTAAELQLEAANGVEDTPFVTVKVTLDDEGNSHFDAFQVSKQCMEMAAEGAIEPHDDPGVCAVNETFTALVEAKESNEVDNNLFLCVVPIEQHDSQVLVSQFPPANREGIVQTNDDLKKQLQKAGTNGWTFIDMLGDFHLLLFLCGFLDIQTDVPRICQSILDKSIPLDEGFNLIIRSLAGLDS
mmetsp:Transcript_29141/g.38327  ORF Transcript_29141/g.38327 Transcript_29141/m.38327 type:complete len:447 (+) Transcript_29141:71-1411(+)